MESVSHLAAGAFEANVAQRAPAQVRVDPIGEDPLVWRAELPRASEHTAAVHPHRKPESLAIFESHRFRRQLGAAVQRNRRRGGECRVNAPRGNARWERPRAIQLKRTPVDLERQ